MSWKRGFWRLCFIVWITGAIGLLVLVPEVMQPFKDVHPEGAPEPQAFLNEQPVGSIAWHLNNERRKQWEYADPAELAEAHIRWAAERRPAFRTKWYRDRLLGLGALGTVWSVVLWGVFYTVAWVAAGFGGRPHEGE